MPPKTISVSPVNADGTLDPAAMLDAVEQLRKGTRETFESNWTRIAASATATFTHLLDDIPWIVDVTRSETSDGQRPADATGDVTISKTATAVVVSNTATAAYYFRVRAL